jgi:hypothetical protein
MIDFTINGKSLAKFPLFRWKNAGNYFMRLDGIDIVIGSGAVTPVYRSLFSTENHPGQFVLILYIGDYGHMLIFQKMVPYFHYEKFKSEIEALEDEN